MTTQDTIPYSDWYKRFHDMSDFLVKLKGHVTEYDVDCIVECLPPYIEGSKPCDSQ